jgi:hypothetical protein
MKISVAPAERVDILINIDAKIASIKSTDVLRVVSKKVNAMNRNFFGDT